MCDFSLEYYRRTTARAGDQLHSMRFQSGSIGITNLLGNVTTVVCLACDTRLLLEEVGEQAAKLGLRPGETIIFVHHERPPKGWGQYRDGIETADGRQFSLQNVGEGIVATVLKIPGDQSIEGGSGSEIESPGTSGPAPVRESIIA